MKYLTIIIILGFTSSSLCMGIPGAAPDSPIISWEPLGEVTVTAYSKERYIGITKSGAIGVPYLTAAIGPNSELKLGDEIYIDSPCNKCHSWFGYFRIQDTGSFVTADIDIMVVTETEAVNWGKRRLKIWRLR